MIAKHIEDFWEVTLQRLAEEPLDATVERLAEPVPYESYRITYRSLDGVYVRAHLARPIGGSSLPAIVCAPGYGGTEQSVMLSECQRGYAILQVYPRGQGESAELWQWPSQDKLSSNIHDPEGHYYQGGYADMVRGVDYLATREDVDPTRIGAMGTSQGGGLVLATAALEPRIRAVVAHVPFLCAMAHAAALEGALVKILLDAAAANNPGSLRTLETFDPLVLAPRIKVPVLMSAGGRDLVCPDESIRMVFDALPGVKSLAHYPDLTHTSCSDFYTMAWQWMKRYLQA